MESHCREYTGVTRSGASAAVTNSSGPAATAAPQRLDRLVVAGQQYSALGVHRMEIAGQPAQPYQVLAFDREGRTTVYANREPHEEGRRPPKAVGLLIGRIVRR